MLLPWIIPFSAKVWLILSWLLVCCKRCQNQNFFCVFYIPNPSKFAQYVNNIIYKILNNFSSIQNHFRWFRIKGKDLSSTSNWHRWLGVTVQDRTTVLQTMYSNCLYPSPFLKLSTVPLHFPNFQVSLYKMNQVDSAINNKHIIQNRTNSEIG